MLKPTTAIDIYRAPATEGRAIRVKCLTCTRWLDKGDIFLGKCAPCLAERVRAILTRFNPFEHSDGIHPKCAECNEVIYVAGMKTWDNLGKVFKLVCAKCGYKQMESDPQYKDTPFGYSKKLK